MTETVKSLNYTKNILQTIPNNDTMEVFTQTNAVKSPTDSLKATTLVYTVEEIAQDRKSTRLNSSHANESRMPSSA